MLSYTKKGLYPYNHSNLKDERKHTSLFSKVRMSPYVRGNMKFSLRQTARDRFKKAVANEEWVVSSNERGWSVHTHWLVPNGWLVSASWRPLLQIFSRWEWWISSPGNIVRLYAPLNSEVFIDIGRFVKAKKKLTFMNTAGRSSRSGVALLLWPLMILIYHSAGRGN